MGDREEQEEHDGRTRVCTLYQTQSKVDQYYYTEELRAIVKRWYANDYKLWNLVKDEEEELMSGRDLAMKLSLERAMRMHWKNGQRKRVRRGLNYCANIVAEGATSSSQAI